MLPGVPQRHQASYELLKAKLELKLEGEEQLGVAQTAKATAVCHFLATDLAKGGAEVLGA